MLALRSQGWSYTALAERFECPKLTIRFLARKHGLGRETVTVQFTRTDHLRITTSPVQAPELSDNEEKVCEGKTYAEYVQEAKERSKHNTYGINSPRLSSLS